MPFAIVAELPLGTYRGAGGDGRPEPIPSLARLHSALLCAAGFGPRAVPGRDQDSLDVSEADKVALRWIEQHPPDHVRIPTLEVNPGRAVAWRDDGTLERPPAKEGKGKVPANGLRTKKLGKRPDSGTAVDGKFAWIWTEAVPPEPVRAALEQLCPDVAYLGTSETPVRLAVTAAADIDPSHERNDKAGLFTVDAMGIDRPVAGRLDELTDAHRAANGKPPSVASDKFAPSADASRSPVPPRRFVERAWYSPVGAEVTDVPWPQVIVIPVASPVPEQDPVPVRDPIPVRDRVHWAVAAHRALIRSIGQDAPAMITGAYPQGIPRPANRVALHLLDPSMPVGGGLRQTALAIFVPGGADAAELSALRFAAENLAVLYGPRAARRNGADSLRLDTSNIRVVEGARFWAAPGPGKVRLWRTVPPAIPETRGARGSEWNFSHAALLSVGFAWKEQLPQVSGRGDSYYRALARAASDAGVTVAHVREFRGPDVNRYAHKVNEHAVVRPYTAYLSMGSLAGAQTVQAIGQSRHLGGGLLVPVDADEGARVGDFPKYDDGGWA